MSDVPKANLEPREAQVQIAKQARKQADEAEQALADLACEYLPEAIFAGVFTLLTVAPEGSASELTHGDVPSKLERLAFYLWRSRTTGTGQSTAQVLQAALQAINELANQSIIAQTFEPTRSGNELEHLISRVLIDAQVIRGSAYPEQTSEEIREIAGRFDAWFQNKLGSPATHFVDALWSVHRAAHNKIDRWLNSIIDQARSSAKNAHLARRRRAQPSAKQREIANRLFSDTVLDQIASQAHSVVPVSRSDCQMPDGSSPSIELWNGLLALIGFTREQAMSGTNFLVARRRPLFVVSDARALLADLPNALDCLWDALDAHAKADEGFYQKFQTRKAEWLEEKTAEFLRRVFGDEHVYRNLIYPDPDQLGHPATAELDTAIHWEPFLILVEAKARQFRLKGQLGDVGRLRTDLKANVEDAFQQAMRAQRYLASVPEAHFKERYTGRVLRVQAQSLRRVYLVTVSLHLLGTAINRLANLQELGMFADGEYPWAISLADLDIITRFTEGPDVFLHYLERRREIERGNMFPINDDVDFFGAYLTNRLHPSAFTRKEKAPDYVLLTGFQVKFDDWMEFQRGTRAERPEIRLEVPDPISAVLQELRRRPDDDSARWIAFALLGLSSPQLAAIAQGIQQAHNQEPRSGRYHRIVMRLDDLVVSMTVTGSQTVDELRKRTHLRATVEKYRQKVSRSIGFGVHKAQHGKPFDCCVWVEGPWEPDPTMETFLEEEPPFSPVPGQKLPGRNNRCFCGSGRKFKKCCLPKLHVTREHD